MTPTFLSEYKLFLLRYEDRDYTTAAILYTDSIEYQKYITNNQTIRQELDVTRTEDLVISNDKIQEIDTDPTLNLTDYKITEEAADFKTEKGAKTEKIKKSRANVGDLLCQALFGRAKCFFNMNQYDLCIQVKISSIAYKILR